MFAIACIALGIVVGLIANHLKPARLGLIADILLGLAGALLGYMVWAVYTIAAMDNQVEYLPGSGQLWAVAVTVAGAVLVLGLVRAIRRPIQV